MARVSARKHNRTDTKRKVASQKFRASHSRKFPFETVFPGVEQMVVVIEQEYKSILGDTKTVYRAERSKPITGGFSGSRFWEHGTGCNLCWGKGLDLPVILRTMIFNKQAHFETEQVCTGHEKQGRRLVPCSNHISLQIDIDFH